MKKHLQLKSLHLECLESRLLFAAGDLDVAFNNNHLATTTFHLGSSHATDVATLADGSIVAVGQILTKKNTFEAAVAEYNFDGTLNTTFGDAGTVVGLPGNITDPTRVQVGSDGSIYILDPNAYAITKLTPTGAVDSTFGTSGVISFPDIQSVTGFTLDSHDNILIAGTTQTSPSFTMNPSNGDLRRYTSAGIIDPNFHGGADVILPPLGKVETESQYRTLTFGTPVVDSAGRILVTVEDALHANHKSGSIDLTNDYLYRFSSTGTIDRTFGSAGNTALPNGNASIAGIMSNGEILLDSNDHLTRYGAAGTLDTTYGTDGTSTLNVTIAQREAPGHAFAVAADGSVTVIAAQNDSNHFGIEHILPNGSLDTDFGANGIVLPTALGQSFADGLTLAPDGTIVIAGEIGSLSGSTDTRTFAVGRLYTSKGPAVQLIPRTLKTKSRYLSMTVEIRDNEGVKLSTLTNNNLKLFNTDGSTRKIRFLSETDVRGDGRFIQATYRIVAPNNQSTWLPSDNGTYQVRLESEQITDDNLNPTSAGILGTLRVLIP